MSKVMKLALTAATTEGMGSSNLRQIVDGFGEFPDAVFDFSEILFNDAGARFTVRAYRNAEALAKRVPLPTADPIILDLPWDELRGTPGAGQLEEAVREAAWGLM